MDKQPQRSQLNVRLSQDLARDVRDTARERGERIASVVHFALEREVKRKAA
jgi:hypothetical protein